MSSSTSNGRQKRRQLSDEIERFGLLLDGLGDAITAAVSDATREGVHLAMKEAIIAVLTDPKLREQLREAAPPAPIPIAQPVRNVSFWERLKSGIARGGRAVGAAVAAVVGGAAESAKSAVHALRNPVGLFRTVCSAKRLLTVGLTAGLIIAIVSYCTPHVFSAAVSGISGGVAAVLLQVSTWTRRTVRALALT
jgi:hypothetical protein